MRITPVGITAVENLTPDSLLHGEEKETALEYLIYFLVHKKGVISKTNTPDSMLQQRLL